MEISASLVKALRDKTGLPMMDCKKALQEANGDEEAAIEILRKAGKKTMSGRTDRETGFGRIAVFTDAAKKVTAMVELLCESAPVTANDGFISLVNSMAEQLAKGPGAKTPEELLSQPSPVKSGATLQFVMDDLVNQIREVFRLSRVCRVAGTCGTYVHHNAGIGVVLQIEGDNAELAKDICMHVASMRPKALCKEDISAAEIEKERAIALEEVKTQNANKPENILQKIVDGKMKTFFAERCLLEQEFVKDASKTVAQIAAEGKIKIVKMVHWELGRAN